MTEKIKKVYQLLEENPGMIVITAHKNPDGDAVGSTLGLFHYLKSEGKNVCVVLPDSFPDFLAWMPGADEIILYDKNKKEADMLFSSATIIFCLDYNRTDRTGDMENSIVSSPAKKILIDHHPHPEGNFDVLYSDTSSCATSEMIFRLISVNGKENKINAGCAACLYAGIMTDSGNFRFPNTTAETHKAVAALLEKGARHDEIYTHVFETSTEDRLRLLGYAISNKMTVLKDLKTAYFVLTKDELNRYNYQKGDTEGMVNYGLTIKGIVASAIFVEQDGIIKVSFRSKGKVAVNELSSAHFNGGGHVNAAGGRSNDSLEETLNRFLQVLPLFMKKYV